MQKLFTNAIQLALALGLIAVAQAQTIYLRNDQPGQGISISDITQGATGAATIVTAAPHTLQTGDRVQISRVLSPCSQANGVRTVTVVNATSFTIRNREDTQPVRCELGYRVYLRIEKLSGQGENVYTAYTLNFNNPRPEVSPAFFGSLADGERVTIKMNSPNHCPNWHNSAQTYVRKEGTSLKIVGSPTDTEWLRCTYGWPYLGDGRDWNTNPQVSKTTAVPLSTTPWGVYDQQLRQRMTSRGTWTSWTQTVKPYVDTFVSEFNALAPGSLEERRYLQNSFKGSGVLWALGTAYAITNNTQYADTVKRVMLNAEYLFPGLGAIPSSKDGARLINSRGDWARPFYAELSMAYSLIRDRVTPAERQAIADRLFSRPEDGCTNNIELRAGRAVRNGNVILGEGTSFTTEFQRGDIVLIPQFDSTQNYLGNTGAMYDQAWVTQVVSDTVMLIDVGTTQPTTGTLTAGASAPTGTCANGSVYLMDVPGTGYKYSFACRSSQWVASDSSGHFDPGSNYPKSGEVRGLTPLYVIKPYRTGQCGFIYLNRHVANPHLAIGNQHYGVETWGEINQNLSQTSGYVSLMMGMAFANDDVRARELAEESWAWYYDGAIKWWRDTYSGAPRQYGSGYYLSRMEEEPVLSFLAVKNQTGGVVDIYANNPKFISNAAWSQAYAWYPNTPSIAIRYGEQSGSDGTSRSTHSGRLSIYEYLAEPTAAAALRKYTHDILGFDSTPTYWGHGGPSQRKQGVLNYLWFADKAGQKTDLTTLPLQRLFRETDTGTHLDPSANNYSWFSGLMSRTSFVQNSNATVVWQDVSACCVDHYLDFNNSRIGIAPGHYHIIKGGSMLSAGLAGNSSTIACDTDGGLACYAQPDRRSANTISIGCDSAEQGCQDNETDRIRPSMIRYSEDAGHAYTMADLKSTTASLSRYQRQLLHLKRPGQQDTIVVFDDVAVAAPATIKNRVVHMNMGRPGDGNTTLDTGLGLITSQTATGSARLLTQMINVDGQQHRLYRHNVAQAPGIVTDCVGSGDTCSAATNAEFMVVHTPTTSTTTAPPVINSLAASSHRIAQIQYPSYAYVAAVKRAGTVQASLSFTSTHSGSATYLITGLQPGGYEVRRGGVVIIPNKTVSTGGLTLEFESSAGVISVTRTSVPPLTITTQSLPGGQVGVPYTGVLATTGGVNPIRWSGNVTKLGASAPILVDIGGSAWGPGSYEGTGNVVNNLPNGEFQFINLPENVEIAETELDRLFRNQIMCNDCSWIRSIGNGSYTVRLAFAEIIGPISNRFISIRLNGTSVESSFSAYLAAGNRMNTAVYRDYPVTVTNGQLQVRWGSGQGCQECRAMLAGVEVRNRTGLVVLSSGALSGSPIETGTFRVAAEVSDGDSPPSGLSLDLNFEVGGSTPVSGLRTDSLETASDGVVWRVKQPGLQTNSPCAVDLARDSGFTDVVESRALSGPSLREYRSVAPLQAATSYHLRVSCGSGVPLTESRPTAATSTQAQNVKVRARSQRAFPDSIRVQYGPTTLVSSEVVSTCSAGICEANLPANKGKRLFYSYQLLRSGVVVGRSRVFALVP